MHRHMVPSQIDLHSQSCMLSKSTVHFNARRIHSKFASVMRHCRWKASLSAASCSPCRGMWFLLRLPQISLPSVSIPSSSFSLSLSLSLTYTHTHTHTHPPSHSFSSHHNWIFWLHVSTYTQLSADMAISPSPWHHPMETKDILWVAVPNSRSQVQTRWERA